ncbi:MAG: tRNA threonylcarbamoyladenosine biosynthesis protein TsaB [Alphaproteobacteria bacterium MarineAlpha3_Bin5]|nr:tRNA (adenosine(37)-N6)-threonylcarbamoyltransferase complex dimerization subunit type 1 TsaB [Magnetovibrio sp.]PPR78997.1 MAG: tRNA threonylcarbamoyladenosine biosynthesis protein TsaB [Alphaproteobacteria bacterium MarineAlpha3_Bin5]
MILLFIYFPNFLQRWLDHCRNIFTSLLSLLINSFPVGNMNTKPLSVLAIETASQACSVALAIKGEVVVTQLKEMSSGQSEALFPMIREILFESGIRYKDIGVVAVTRGPGSFTGVRIGLAAAHGIALARKIPIFDATTLEVITFKALTDDRPQFPVLSVIKTKQETYYAQIFSKSGLQLCAPRLAAVGGICDMLQETVFSTSNIFLTGDIHSKIVNALKEKGWGCMQSTVPSCASAYWLARLAIKDTHKTSLGGVKKFPEPFYLQPLDAKPAKFGGQLRPS